MALDEGEWRDDLALEGLGEHADDALDAVPQHVEAGLNGLSFGRSSLIERYAVGDLAFQLDLALAADGDSPSSQLRAILHWPSLGDLNSLERDAAISLKCHLALAKERAREIERAVLIGVAELVKNPEQVPFGFAPAVVKGLDGFNDFAGWVSETSDLPEPSGTIRIPKQRLVFEDGEFRSARWLPIETAERVDSVIEGGPQTVDCLTDHNAPLHGRSSDHVDTADLLASLSVYIERDAVGAILKPPLDRRVESIRMLVRSFDLQPGTLQWTR